MLIRTVKNMLREYNNCVNNTKNTKSTKSTKNTKTKKETNRNNQKKLNRHMGLNRHRKLNRHKKLKRNKKLKRILDKLVQVGILALTLLFIGYCIVHNFNKAKAKENNTDNISFIKINFKNIDTTPDEYEKLKQNCIAYARNNNVNVENIKTNIDISEETYTDLNIDNDISATDSKMYETGPIYLDNALLLRFINEKGEMQIIASCIKNVEQSDVNKVGTEAVNEYITVDSSGLNKIFENTSTDTADSQDSATENIYDIADNFNKSTISINQENYFIDIESIFIKVINESFDNADSKLKNKIKAYFTTDGYNNIIRSMSRISGANIRVLFIDAGKSSIGNKSCDRILLQLVNEENNKNTYTTIVIKLNSSNKIFDIDVL